MAAKPSQSSPQSSSPSSGSDTPGAPGASGDRAAAKKAARAERQGAQLRANLHRRKDQARRKGDSDMSRRTGEITVPDTAKKDT